MTTTITQAERIHLDHNTAKRLGNWTTASAFEVRVRNGSAVLDLRSPAIAAGDINLDLELRGSVLVLLVPEDATIDQRDLRFDGRGRVVGADREPAEAPRTIVLHGCAADSQIRVRRGGFAQITAMMSREYINDLRAAHREGRMPVIDDPARS